MRNWLNLFEHDETTAFGELDRYTRFSAKRMRSEAVAWLRENFPVTEPLVLYRGITIEHDDMRKLGGNDLDALNAVCEKWLGKPSHELGAGQSCVVRRGNMSSWSHAEEIGHLFAATSRKMGSTDARIVVQATIPAEKIICDLTKLPPHFEQRFPEQMEVIVATGSYPATVIKSAFRPWNPNAMHGYEWGALKFDA
jgi:hypothetical protein